MSLAQSVLNSLPSALHKNGMVRLATVSSAASPSGPSILNSSALGALAKGRAFPEEPSLSQEWQAKLSRGEFARGVVELSSEGGIALGTSVALRACLRVQQDARSAFGVVPWCAFVDPTGSLYAPGVYASGVDLGRLLVVRPDEESLVRVTLRLIESKVFPLVVVDLKGLPGEHFEPSLNPWVRVVRRISRALEGTCHSVLLLTDKNAKRSLPLPVTERLLLSRLRATELRVTVSKSLSGHPGQAKIRWARRLLPENSPSTEMKAHAG